MKKFKTLLVVLILITVIVGIANSVFGSDNRTELTLTDEQKTENMNITKMRNHNNVYCIEHGQKMGSEVKTFNIGTKVVINGETAKFYTKKGDKYELVKTVENEANNILGAILTDGRIDGKKGIRGSTYTTGYNLEINGDWKYTDAQLGLYKYINNWKSEVKAEDFGFDIGGEPLTQSDLNLAEKVIIQAKNKVEQYSYNITIRLLTNVDARYQSLIVTEPEDPTPKLIDIPVQKDWNDGENKYNSRPIEILVRLFANGVDTNKTVVLSEKNQWKSKFTDLKAKDENNKVITYTFKEEVVPGYEVNYEGNRIINTYKININVTKKWEDEDNLDEIRPKSIKVILLQNDKPTKELILDGSKTDENGNWIGEFTNLDKYDSNGKEILYDIDEVEVTGYTDTCSRTEDDNGNIIFTMVNTHKPYYHGYIEITGKVWNDLKDGKANAVNGVLDDDEKGISGIKVKLKAEDGSDFTTTVQDKIIRTYTTTTDENGNYTIKVNYDNNQNEFELGEDGKFTKVKHNDKQNVYKLDENHNTILERLKKAYVEFEYDGMKYTTVKDQVQTKKVIDEETKELKDVAAESSEQSKAIENEGKRKSFDEAHSTVTSSTQHPDNWGNENDTDTKGSKNITAVTKDVISFENYSDKVTTSREETIKYCNGNGTYIRTNNNNSWEEPITGEHSCADCNGTGHSMKDYKVDVQIIQNVNLGLFDREQPDVAIYSDLSEVEVTMNGQKYTYIYGVRTDKYENIDLKVKFQNKDTYTYRRPVNPADIAYLKEEANKNEMNVLVTYKVSIGNLSSTLPITVHNITNYYDKEYTLTTEGWTSTPGEEFNKATYNGDLNVKVEPGNASNPIELTYAVSIEAIRNLLNEEATLNNAVEIESYSTEYGKDTLYAEQRTGGRNGQAYAGYDYNSHPGNAGIKLVQDTDGVYRLKSTENLVEYVDESGKSIIRPEDDTDIAPSFVLCEDKPKILSGTVWEDSQTRESANDKERLGNGYYESEEPVVQNVKLELYEIVRDDDGNVVSVDLAKLYDSEGNTTNAIVYTDTNGQYSFEGVKTSEYYIKTTYGNNTEKLGSDATTMDDGETTVNARNYKSTIITDSTIKDILNKDYIEFSKQDKKWHITHEDGYSIAVDNMIERLGIEDLKNSNYADTINMTAYTKPFELQLEFEANGESTIEATEGELESRIIEGTIGTSNELNKFDFGIIERPREDLFVETTITYFEIALANGSIITRGNPITDILNYAKPMGLDMKFSNGLDARKILNRTLLVEVDNELIQGSTAKILYETSIKNNNEIDYDYGVITDYTDIVNSDIVTEYDKYITQSDKAKYYYYGDSSELSKMKATIMYVDYLNKEVGYTNSDEWSKLEATKLHEDGLISSEVLANTAQRYLLRKEGNETVTLARDESFTQSMLTTKAGIANVGKNQFDNSLEIICIDGKSARTIESTENGRQVDKKYIPGNYIPGSYSAEQDDDVVVNIITGPTGTNNTIIYIITGFVGLIVICGTIIFIKKKVITK